MKNSITLFTSASRPKYANDVLTVLSLPSGMKYQFRYSTKYAVPEIKTIFEAEVQSCRAIVVFRDESAEQSGHSFMVPIRWVDIISVKRISDFYVISFIVAGYPTPTRTIDEGTCQDYIQSLNPANKNLPIQPGIPNLVEVTENEKTTWIDIAKCLADNDNFKETHFIKIARIYNKNGDLKISDTFTYTICERDHFNIQIDYFAQYFGENHEASLEVTSDSSILRIASGSKIYMNSRYDSRQIWLQPSVVPDTTLTEIIIQTQDQRPGVPQTQVYLPIEIVRSTSWILWRMVTSMVGSSLIALPGIMGSGMKVEIKLISAFFGAGFLTLSGLYGVSRK